MNILVAILKISLKTYVYTAQFFHYLPLLIGLPCAWLCDQYGTRLIVYLCLIVCALRNCFRALMFAPNVAHWNQLAYYYWLVEYFFRYVSLSFYYCLPLKISEEWFLERERSFAWSMIMVAPNLGSALASYIIPRQVDVNDLQSTLKPIGQVYLYIYFVSFVVLCSTVQRSRPREGAPNERNKNSLVSVAATETSTTPNNNDNNKNIWPQLKRMLTNKHLMIQMLCLQFFDGMQWSVGMVLQDILAGAHLSQVFAGQFMSANYLFSSLIQVIGSIRMKPAANLKRHSFNDVEQSLEQTKQNNNDEDKSRGVKEDEQKHQQQAADVYKTRECKIYIIVQCTTYLLFCATLLLQHFQSNGQNETNDDHSSPAWLNWLCKSQWWLVVGTNLVFTFVRSWAVPSYTEQNAQLISGSVSEATISVLQTALSSITLNICSAMFISLRGQGSDYTRSILFASVFVVVVTSIYVLCFGPKQSDYCRHRRRRCSRSSQLSSDTTSFEDEQENAVASA